MAWASARCKAHAPRLRPAPPPSAAQLQASPRVLPPRYSPQLHAPRPPFGGPPTPQDRAPRLSGGVTHQRRNQPLLRASPRYSQRRSSPHTTGALHRAHPHHLLQAHEPSGCNHRRSALRRSATRRQPPGALRGPATHHRASVLWWADRSPSPPCFAARRCADRRIAAPCHATHTTCPGQPGHVV